MSTLLSLLSATEATLSLHEPNNNLHINKRKSINFSLLQRNLV